jgi:endonuclease/exonuclease/phosphatase family metal-dependent hydrolase
MKRFRLAILYFCLILTTLAVTFIILWRWNFYSPLNKWPTSIEIISEPTKSDKKIIKIASYNIKFATSLDWKIKQCLKKETFIKQLNMIAHILKKIDADIVLLQEIDFSSERSHYIDQARFLAKKANYSFIAKAPLLKTRFYPTFNGKLGKLDYGLCVLSKLPLENQTMHIFDYPQEIPFYLRWLYPLHGLQKIQVLINNQKINVINAHFDPFSSKTQQKEITILKKWIKKITFPLILCGDFNAPAADLNFDDLTEVVTQYIESPTYPSDKPKEQIDHIFINKTSQMSYGYVEYDAKKISDHLPIVGYLKIE